MTASTAPNSVPTLDILEQRTAFVHRHIGPSEAQIKDMLAVLGVGSLDELTAQTVPLSLIHISEPTRPY